MADPRTVRTSKPDSPEEGRAEAVLRGTVDRPGPRIVVLTHSTDPGVPPVLERSIREMPFTHLPCADLTEADHRALLGARLRTKDTNGTDDTHDSAPSSIPPDAIPTWEEIFRRAAGPVASAGIHRALVMTDVDRLITAGTSVLEEMAEGWKSIHRTSRPLTLVLCTGAPRLAPEDSRGWLALEPYVELDLPLPDLSLPSTADRLGAWKPRSRLLAWCLLGGDPARLRLLDTGKSLGRNVTRLLLDPDGPLYRDMDRLLHRPSLTQPGRYGSLLALVSRGATTWGAIRRGLGAQGEGRPGPYVAKLRELGLLESRVSLDASGGQRGTRYALPDPLARAWYRWILPERDRILRGLGREVWDQVLAPALRDDAPARVPDAVRGLLPVRGHEFIGSDAREVGSLWGPDYDIPVAGTCRNGAIFYGAGNPGWEPPTPSILDGLDAAMRETRYGFGRERRLRILATLTEPGPPLLRIAARDESLTILGPDDLLGPDPLLGP